MNTAKPVVAEDAIALAEILGLSLASGVESQLRSDLNDKIIEAVHQNGLKYADLFAAPFENLPLREAIDFYKHERDWANRLIAGDSLLVMNSLLQPKKIDNGQKPLSLPIHSQGLLLISDLIHRKPVLGLTEGGF